MTQVNLLDLAAAALTSTVAASLPIREKSTTFDAKTKHDGSVVTDADFAAQGVIVRCLRLNVEGDYRIVGEESEEEMEAHLTDETEQQKADRERIFRMAQRELYMRYNGDDVSKPPLAKSEEDDSTDDLSELPEVIKSDDKADYIVDSSRISIFVDPLDGTKSYAKGDFETVTVLVAIILDNLPYFGVITKPFNYKDHPSLLDTGIAVYGGLLLGGVYLAGGPKCESRMNHDLLPRAVISSSRSAGIVQDFVDHLGEENVVHQEPIHVSGAGEKSLRLVLGSQNESLWFFPKRGTARWDVAASDALLRCFGGIVTDKFGKELDYSVGPEMAENEDGIIASNSADVHAACVRMFNAGDWKTQ